MIDHVVHPCFASFVVCSLVVMFNLVKDMFFAFGARMNKSDRFEADTSSFARNFVRRDFDGVG